LESTVALSKSIAICQDVPLVGLVQVIAVFLSCASPLTVGMVKPVTKPAIPAAKTRFWNMLAPTSPCTDPYRNPGFLKSQARIRLM
jgi:hypothetical protein